MTLFRIRHPYRVFQVIYYGTRWRLKQILKIAEKLYSVVINSGFDVAAKRYRRIGETILEHLTKSNSLDGSVVGEIGSVDCLATADMILDLGVRQVQLNEYFPIVVMQSHYDALKPLVDDSSLPNRGEILDAKCLRLNDLRVIANEGLLENVGIPEPVYLSGHEYFEDSFPPLDIQTYLAWLFNLMFPKYIGKLRVTSLIPSWMP